MFCVCRRVGGLNVAMLEVEYVLCLKESWRFEFCNVRG